MLMDSLFARVSMQFYEHYVRAGKILNFFATGTVSSPNTINLAILTGTKKTFAYINVGAGTGTLTIRETVTATGGSAITGYNRDRNSITTFLTTAAQDPTVSGAGTLIRSITLGAAGSIDEKIRLLPSTKYSIIFTPAGASNAISINADVYEE